MTSLYLILNLGSISVPLFYSIYEKKFHFIQYIQPLSLSILITAFLFIAWDIWFTQAGVWGFNPTYLLGLHLFHLPVEEWLFFLCIPYASIFTHEVLKHFYPNIGVQEPYGYLIVFLLIGLALVTAFTYHEHLYTVIDFSLFAAIILIGYLINKKELYQFLVTYLVILIPFFLVNGILTGSFIEKEIVWYNNEETLGIRLGTIPVEDIFYGFSMIFMSILVFQKLFSKRKNGAKAPS